MMSNPFVSNASPCNLQPTHNNDPLIIAFLDQENKKFFLREQYRLSAQRKIGLTDDDVKNLQTEIKKLDKEIADIREMRVRYERNRR